MAIMHSFIPLDFRTFYQLRKINRRSLTYDIDWGALLLLGARARAKLAGRSASVHSSNCPDTTDRADLINRAKFRRENGRIVPPSLSLIWKQQ